MLNLTCRELNRFCGVVPSAPVHAHHVELVGLVGLQVGQQERPPPGQERGHHDRVHLGAVLTQDEVVHVARGHPVLVVQRDVPVEDHGVA